ncbi:MAG: hypothetical protein F6J93_29000 [Oscillatoria sp. SIO1A7]|nr:hypothetical protein [Oscillatoria sp. SIO1A7]
MDFGFWILDFILGIGFAAVGRFCAMGDRSSGINKSDLIPMDRRRFDSSTLRLNHSCKKLVGAIPPWLPHTNRGNHGGTAPTLHNSLLTIAPKNNSRDRHLSLFLQKARSRQKLAQKNKSRDRHLSLFLQKARSKQNCARIPDSRAAYYSGAE